MQKDWRHSSKYKQLVMDDGIDAAEAWYALKTNKLRVVAQTEQELQRKVLEHLRAQGIIVWENHITGLLKGSRVTANPNRGMPDIMGILPNGTFFAIELKRADFKPPKPQYDERGLATGDYLHHIEQEAWLQKLTTPHTVTGFCKSISEVDRLIESII